MRIVGLALGAFAYFLLAPALPDVPAGVEGAVGTLAVFAVVVAIATLGDEPFAAVLVGFGALMTAATLTAAGADTAATVPEAATCACIGAMFGRVMDLPALVLVLPVVVAVLDVAAVVSGGVPFAASGSSGDLLSLDIPAWGGGTALRIGIADPVFAAVFWAWARQFDFRRTPTAVALACAPALAVVLVVSAHLDVPALPLLAAAFYLPNLDRLGGVLQRAT